MIPVTLNDLAVVVIVYRKNLYDQALKPSLPPGLQIVEVENFHNSRYHSAAKPLNEGIESAKATIILCCHEDLIFGPGWFPGFIDQINHLDNWGILGVVGGFIDKTIVWGHDPNYTFPLEDACMDECCIILDKAKPLRFDQSLPNGFHAYGKDICLESLHQGYKNYIMGGPTKHLSASFAHDPAWYQDYQRRSQCVKDKWRPLFPKAVETI